MTLDQLRIFLAAADHMNFTRAAEALYMTQSSVSAAIHNLEDRYDMKLFNRIGRHIEITEAGRLLQVEAQKILGQVTLTERGLGELSALRRGELHLGASRTVGNYWLPPKISRFKQQYPGIQIYCTLGNTKEISAGIANRKFDLGFVEGEIEPTICKVLELETVGSDHLIIVVGKHHPWYKSAMISASELLTTTWIMREQGSGTRSMFERALGRWGIACDQLKIALEMSSGEMVKSVVENGESATAISKLMVKKELRLKTLYEVPIYRLARPVKISRCFFKIRHRQCFQTRSSHAFSENFVDQPKPSDVSSQR
ncbi:LysR family transcriptional regulator [cf. Phormidesmis sp. LEGE 11477]|nr:LysR family transcriptional regulator [cf. Phormidesmis sp. LEGE 11477]MBE9061398.1 LysR family transcriptional regulator [cf. Phormidesmis sp. LEGE 11477]